MNTYEYSREEESIKQQNLEALAKAYKMLLKKRDDVWEKLDCSKTSFADASKAVNEVNAEISQFLKSDPQAISAAQAREHKTMTFKAKPAAPYTPIKEEVDTRILVGAS